MEDRFRFRWWDYNDKEYTYDVQDLCEMDCFGSACGTDCWGNPNIENADNFGDLLVLQAKGYGVIEQCTGSRDWKNHLIYSGDVIKLVGPNWRFVVAWNNPDARFTFDELDNVNWWNLSASVAGFISMGVEVIGNIHENSELLEGKQ